MFNSLIIAITMLTVISCSSKKEETNKDNSGHNNAKTETTVEEKTGKAQTTCPIMKGNPINKDLYVDVEGKRVYYCCGGCGDAIKKDAKTIIAQFKAEGVTLEDAPK